MRAGTIITDDVLAGIAATRDMIDGPGEFKTKGMGHGAGVSPSPGMIARPDPVSSASHLYRRQKPPQVITNLFREQHVRYAT